MTAAVRRVYSAERFEDLEQRRRIRSVEGIRCATQEAAEAFGESAARVAAISTSRNCSMRRLSHAMLAPSLEMRCDCRCGIGQNFQDGKLVLNPQVMRYLERTGKVAPKEANGPDS